MADSNVMLSKTLEYIQDHFNRLKDESCEIYHGGTMAVPWKEEEIFTEQPGNLEEFLRLMLQNIEQTGLHMRSGRCVAGFNAAGGCFHAALGEFYMSMSGIYNNPDLRQVFDNSVINWVSRAMGLPGEVGGIFSSGGSASTIISFLVAREAMGCTQDNMHRCTAYMSDGMHFCGEKALTIVGMSTVQCRVVKSDQNKRLVVEHLEELVLKDVQDGYNPLMVMATLGETCMGHIDPLKEVGSVAVKHNMWYHVDACYGGLYLLCDDIRQKSKGIEKADSITADFHKGAFQPFASSCVILKNKEHAALAFRNQNTSAFATPLEANSPFRSFPIWFSLNLFGETGIRELQQEKLYLISYMYSVLTMYPIFDLHFKPTLGKLLFRVQLTEEQDKNAATTLLYDTLNKDTRFHFSMQIVDGILYVQLGVYQLQTHLSSVRDDLRHIILTAKQLFPSEVPESTHLPVSRDETFLKQCEEKYRDCEEELLKFGAVNKILLASRTDTYHESSDDDITSVDIPVKGRELESVLRQLTEITHSWDNSQKKGVESITPALIGHFLRTTISSYSIVGKYQPGCTELESNIIRRLCEVMGMPDSAAGILCCDEVSADILCLQAARHAVLTQASHPQRYSVYGTQSTLDGLQQTLHVLGLSELKQTTTSVDAEMSKFFESVVSNDSKESVLPFLLVINVDKAIYSEDRHAELRKIISQCREQGIWVHVQAHQGAPLLLGDLQHSQFMLNSGLCDADSISVDLTTSWKLGPQRLSAVLVRDLHQLERSLALREHQQLYFTSTRHRVVDPWKYTFELSRPAREVTAWSSLYLNGTKALQQHAKECGGL